MIIIYIISLPQKGGPVLTPVPPEGVGRGGHSSRPAPRGDLGGPDLTQRGCRQSGPPHSFLPGQGLGLGRKGKGGG